MWDKRWEKGKTSVAHIWVLFGGRVEWWDEMVKWISWCLQAVCVQSTGLYNEQVGGGPLLAVTCSVANRWTQVYTANRDIHRHLVVCVFVCLQMVLRFEVVLLCGMRWMCSQWLTTGYDDTRSVSCLCLSPLDWDTRAYGKHTCPATTTVFLADNVKYILYSYVSELERHHLAPVWISVYLLNALKERAAEASAGVVCICT